jgi:Ni,Fe-hydrogenase III small subunit/formate hydrogenlyase subunit 6/NADH:ubiquinone oxidoreductase subunit I
MLRLLRGFVSEGVVTNDFPSIVAEPPEGFLGKPLIDFERCTACDKCAEACPTGAISVNAVPQQDIPVKTERILSLNYGDCIFCGECAVACPDAISMTKEFQLAATNKEDLVTRARYRVDGSGKFRFVEIERHAQENDPTAQEIGLRLKEKIHKLLGRSLHIREVDAGSCNGCEVEITSLNNPVYDIERFGIHFVASPRHADMLLVTGPVTRNMEIALKHTSDATPGPKVVVAVGACAIGGGIFGKSYASCGGVDNILPVDVFIPGCPPRPEALLHGILLAVGRLSQSYPG